MESNEVADRTAAEAQLATLRAQRAALAERALAQPWWYDALLSLLVFAFVASYSLHDTWVTLGAVVLLLLCLRGMVALYWRRTGFWVHGFRKGRTRRAVAVWVVAYLAVFCGALVVETWWRGAMVVAGAVLGVVLYLVNRWWVRIFVAELQATP